MFLSQKMDADGLIHRYEITRFFDVLTASQLLGHSDINTTLKITIEKRIRDANPFFYGKAIGRKKQPMRHKYFFIERSCLYKGMSVLAPDFR